MKFKKKNDKTKKMTKYELFEKQLQCTKNDAIKLIVSLLPFELEKEEFHKFYINFLLQKG